MSHTDITTKILAAAAPFVVDILYSVDGRRVPAFDRDGIITAIQAIEGVTSVGLHTDVAGLVIANVELSCGECVSVTLIDADPARAVAKELVDAIGGSVLSWDNPFSVQQHLVSGIAKAIRARDIKIAVLEAKLDVLECRADASESMAAHTQSIAYQALHSSR